MTTIQHKLEELQCLRHILVMRARNPRTCPRRAVETESELAAIDGQIAELSAKIGDAAPAAEIIAFPGVCRVASSI